MIKVLYIALAILTLGLGVLGIFLPVLPTTPFLLLTAYFSAKGSDRFHTWFVNTKIYIKYGKTFAETKSMTKKAKWRLMIFVDLMLLISFITIDMLALRILIVLLIAVKYWYFFTKVGTLLPKQQKRFTARFEHVSPLNYTHEGIQPSASSMYRGRFGHDIFSNLS